MLNFQRLSLCLLLFLFLVQCSKKSRTASNGTEPTRNDYIQVLDETPQRIQELENLSVFPGDSEPAYSIELIPKQTFGKSGEPFLTQVIGCVVDDKGRVIIEDQRRYSNDFPFVYRVHAYNGDGTYHRQIGGPGRGPGEYGIVLGLQAKAEKVYVLDYTGKRVNVYNTDDYSLKGTTLIERLENKDYGATQGLDFGYFTARSDGNLMVMFDEFVMGTDRSTEKYLLMDTDGNPSDFEALEFQGNLKMGVEATPPRPSIRLPFMGETVIALSNDDALHAAWTQSFLIKKYDEKGNYQSAIYYPVMGPAFSLSDYTEEAGYSKGDVMNALDELNEELPEMNHIIARMKVDDENRIWVAVPTAVEGDTYEWWVLKETGELLGKLLLPRDKPIYDIKNGYLYSENTNEETGTEYVVKYRIALTEK